MLVLQSGACRFGSQARFEAVPTPWATAQSDLTRSEVSPSFSCQADISTCRTYGSARGWLGVDLFFVLSLAVAYVEIYYDRLYSKRVGGTAGDFASGPIRSTSGGFYW